MKKAILMLLGVTLLTVNIIGQSKNEIPLKIKKVRKYDVKKDEYQFAVGTIVGPTVNTNQAPTIALSTTYFRQIANRYYVGFSINKYEGYSYKKHYNTFSCDLPSNSYTYENKTVSMNTIMLESKMRMNRAQRTHRFAGYAGFGIGYIKNNSYYSSSTFLPASEGSTTYYSHKYFENKNSIVVKASVQLKFNLSKNSGLFFENSISVYNNQYKNYSSNRSISEEETGATPFLTFKAGFFF